MTLKRKTPLRKTPLRRGRKPERTPKGAIVVVATQKELEWISTNPVAKKHLRRIPKGATPIEKLLGEGLIQRASTFKAKPKPMKKRAASNPGWWFIALEIWDERSRVCEVCGVSLGDEPRPEFFSHLLPRGGYRKYKLFKPNIVLKCDTCHHTWHHEGPNKLRFFSKWEPVCELYYTLQREANGVEG